MDQPINPFVSGSKAHKGPVTREMLEDKAAELNRSAFVIGQGWHYYVGQVWREGGRGEPGKWLASLERRDGAAPSTAFRS